MLKPKTKEKKKQPLPSPTIQYRSTLTNAMMVMAINANSSSAATLTGPTMSVKNPSCLVRKLSLRHKKMKRAYPTMTMDTGSRDAVTTATVRGVSGPDGAAPGFSSAVNPTRADDTPPRETAMDSQDRKVRSLAVCGGEKVW